MRKFPEVHWSEGMFLRPQHFQLAARRSGSELASAARAALPLSWGFAELEIADDQLEAGTVAVRRCDAVFRDGTRAHLPTNLRIPARPFKSELDAAGGRLPVFVGIPALREGEPNTPPDEGAPRGAELRYERETIELADENLGGTPQPIEVRKLVGRLFFGEENREGYETLPLAVVERGGQGRVAPVLSREFIPPVLDLAAWPRLLEIAEQVLHRVEAKSRFLRAEISEGRIALDSEGVGGWQPILKLQIVGSFLHVLRQLLGVSRVHPFQLHLELSRLAGELSIFDEGGAEEILVPLYDQDRIGESFLPLVRTVERLLEKILAGRFVRVEFDVRGELLVAYLDEAWFTPESEFHLCVESDLSDREIGGRLETAKLGTTADIPLLKQRRLFGLDIELLKRAPGGLPARENLHYFAIAKEGPYWADVARAREIGISGGIDRDLRFALYIVLRPGKKT